MLRRVVPFLVLALGFAGSLQAQTLTIPTDLQPANVANTALTQAAPGIGVLIAATIAISVVVAVVALVRRSPRRMARG